MLFLLVYVRRCYANSVWPMLCKVWQMEYNYGRCYGYKICRQSVADAILLWQMLWALCCVDFSGRCNATVADVVRVFILFVCISCGHNICHSGTPSITFLYNICQHKPMAVTPSITYMVYPLPHMYLQKITGHTNTNTPTVLEIVKYSICSDLRKPCWWPGKSLSPANKTSVFENNRT